MHRDEKGQVAASWSGVPMPGPGDVIADKYRIEAVLGRGGMSVVYRATHLLLEQQVAIKVLSAEALLLPEYVVRLKREAHAVSRIRSEHVVRVHDIGELPNGGAPYLVMECLNGLDLAAVLARRGPFPLDLAIECIMQACEALAEAHAIGIIHRDLKPANLFLSEALDGSPSVKVLDFGISRMSHRHGLSSLTDPGTVLGTPSYMAPEQMEGSDALDARSDIWALGTILYELLVGKPPYSGDSLPQLFVKIMRARTPRPSAKRAGVRSDIDDIVCRCLEVDPADRFETVAELAWALSRVGAAAHARDSAARISRVLDRQSSEARRGAWHASLPRCGRGFRACTRVCRRPSITHFAGGRAACDAPCPRSERRASSCSASRRSSACSRSAASPMRLPSRPPRPSPPCAPNLPCGRSVSPAKGPCVRVLRLCRPWRQRKPWPPTPEPCGPARLLAPRAPRR